MLLLYFNRFLNRNWMSTYHGFMKNRSTVINLLELTVVKTFNIDNGNNVNNRYYFFKAFDIISYSKLSYPLEVLNIIGNILICLTDTVGNFLSCA